MNTTEYFKIKSLFHATENGKYTILPGAENVFEVRFRSSYSPKEYVSGVVLYRAPTYEECVSWCNGYDARIFYEGVLHEQNNN